MTPTQEHERFLASAARGIATDGPVLLDGRDDHVKRGADGRKSDDLADFRATDLGNAELLVRRHGDALRFCHAWAKWLCWDGTRWAVDDSGEVHRRAASTVRELYGAVGSIVDDERRKAIAKHAVNCEAKSRLDSMVHLAANQAELVIRPEDLDTNPMVLNVTNGTVDLCTGELRPHDRGHHISKLAPVKYDPEAQCPQWLRFLHRIFDGHAKLISFVQRACGYSLTAKTGEQCLFLCHGTGANGKSTLLETILHMLGDYALMTPSETLLLKRTEGIPNDVARLRGARYVSAIETEENRRLAESRIKSLTGGDTISARFMRGEWFDFEPEFKLWLGTNHRPHVKGTDLAIWRRIRLIPFTVTIPPAERDPELKDKLKAELPGILRWAVLGCLEWQRRRLDPPDAVRLATADYRKAEDQLGRFVEECCETGDDDLTTPSRRLYNRYKAWADDTGERPLHEKGFGERMTERGFKRVKTKAANVYRGITLSGVEGGG